MANRQLKIWRDDLRRYYDKTSLMMRVVIGAVLSFIFAYYTINKVVKPQNALNSKLKQKVDTMEVIDDVESRVVDLKNDTRKASRRLESIEAFNAKATAEYGDLSRGAMGEGVLALRSMIDKYELRIISESKGAKSFLKNNNYRRRINQERVKETVKIVFPPTMNAETQSFSVLGSYDHLRQFLMAVHSCKFPIFVNNIKINQSKEMLTDRELNQYRALRCEFEVHVPYLKAEPAVAAKGGAKK